MGTEMPGHERQPSPSTTGSPWVSTNTGLTSTMGSRSSESTSQSTTTRRFVTPSCGAARPHPSLPYMAFAICLASFFRLLSPGSHGSHTVFRTGSGDCTMEVMLNTSFMRFMMAGGRNRRAAIGGFVS